MPATLTTASAILKEVYEPKIQDQLQQEAVALKRIERDSDNIETQVGGKYVTFPLHVRRNQGLGARNELEALPTPGQQGYASARISLKYLYGAVRLSGQTLELADSNPQAFASVLDQEMNGLKDDLRKDQNRQVYGDGSGAIATSTTVVASGVTMTVSFATWAQLGMQIDVIDGATLGNPTPTVKASNRQITAIDVTAKTITFDGANIAIAVGDIIVRTGNVNREWAGFGVVIKNSGTFQNVDPTVEPSWKSEIDSNAGVNRALSEGLMILMADRIRTNGGKVTAMFSNLGVRRAYFNLLSQQRRYTNTTEFEGGFRGLAFTTDQGDIPFVVDVDAPPNRVYFVNEKEITLYREKDWSFMDRDGSKFARVAGFDAYDATMYQYSNLGTHRRNTHGLLADITEG
jgi:hypothetical protein